MAGGWSPKRKQRFSAWGRVTLQHCVLSAGTEVRGRVPGFCGLDRSYFQIRSRSEVLGGREFGVTLFIPLHCVSGVGDEGFSGPSSHRPGKDMAQGRNGLGNSSHAHHFPSVMSISVFLKLQTVFFLVAAVVYLFW